MSRPTEEGPTRRALLIGIDKYTAFPDKFGALNGCVADIELMRSILIENFGFPDANVTVLKNSRATRKRILSALDRVVGETGTDDVVVIHYAGHGSQMTDREGDEPSGLDSTIVPVDSAGWSGRKEEQRDITDDEIHLRLLALGEKTPYTTLIFDCCHSGTISRDAFGGGTRSIPADTRPIHQLPASPIPEAVQKAMRENRARGAGAKGRSGWLPLEGRYVLIAGCRDDEIAHEHQPPEGNGKLVHGALTYFMAQELRAATPGTTYRDVFDRAASKVNSIYRKQHPQLEGAADREVFGIRDIEQVHFVPVTGKRGKTIVLGAGAAHGVTVGSRYAVHPEGTKSPGRKPPLAELVVTRVGGLSSSASVEPASGLAAVAAGTRAFETEHAFGELQFRVQIVADPRFDTNEERLRDAMKAFPLLKHVRENQRADARVYLLPPRTATRKQDPVPQLRVVRSPRWVTVGVDGRLAAPLKDLEEYSTVAANLDRLARVQFALSLENPDRASRLQGRFDLELLRQGSNGAWAVAEPDPASGHVVFEEGDAIAFRLRSRHDEPAYFNLLDFGLDGEISRILPGAGASPEFAPGVTFEHFTDGSAQVELPAVFPFVDDPEGGVAQGLNSVKLIVTAQPADFGFLEQGGMRGEAAAPPSGGAGPAGRGTKASPLAMLFDTAVNATRNVRVTRVGAEDWTTVTRTFLVRRAG